MVGVPGTEERLALAEIEDRLRYIRSRFNLYNFQRNLYTFGCILALGIAFLIICAFSLSPFGFTLLSWPVLLILAFLFVFYLRRSLLEWTNLNRAARQIDAKAGLKERLSTLVAQLTAGVIGKPPPSQLWSHLLKENTDLFPEWTAKKVAPRRIPWQILPFLAALLLAFFIAAIPLMSARSVSNPFSLSNLQSVLTEFPERAGEAFDKQLSLLPDPPEQWGKSSLYNQDSNSIEFALANEENQQDNPDAHSPEQRSLASLPEALQQQIRRALEGLPDKDPPPQTAADLPGDRRLALKPSDPSKKPTSSIQAKNLPQELGKQRPGANQGQGGEKKDGTSGGTSNSAQGPAQGSGIQQLEHARLGRKNARGAFQPDPNSPQMPGSGSEAGEGGPGAGSGTDPRLYGQQQALGDGSNTFQLALETTHEKSFEEGTEIDEKYEGGIIEKSSGTLSQQQSLDDAIRKSRVPPEYEEIVKRVFSRGESR